MPSPSLPRVAPPERVTFVLPVGSKTMIQTHLGKANALTVWALNLDEDC